MEKWPKLYAPNKLTEENLSGTVCSIGTNDYKPSIAVLNEKEMVMFTEHTNYENDHHLSAEEKEKGRYSVYFHTVMYRTVDGGETWQSCGHMPFHGGHEPSATVIDGVLYVQTHEFQHLFADHDHIIDRIFCSEDKGKTWYETRVDAEYLGVPEGSSMCLGRNFMKLHDGSVAGFVSVGEGRQGYAIRLTTKDHGRTWEQEPVTTTVSYKEGCSRAVLCETFFFRSPNRTSMLAISRVDWSLFSAETKKQIPYSVAQEVTADIDSKDGLILLESKDEGLTWEPVRGLGYMSMMYGNLLYLNERDILLTYTKRIPTCPSPYSNQGVQAILGREEEDGSFSFDFENDIIIIDDRMPDYGVEGGGYGTTLMLSDGSLITPYCYRVNSPELDAMLKDDSFDSEEVFMRYYEDTGALYQCPTIDHFRNASYDLRKYLVVAFAQERKESKLVTEVLKWKLDL